MTIHEARIIMQGPAAARCGRSPARHPTTQATRPGHPAIPLRDPGASPSALGLRGAPQVARCSQAARCSSGGPVLLRRPGAPRAGVNGVHIFAASPGAGPAGSPVSCRGCTPPTGRTVDAGDGRRVRAQVARSGPAGAPKRPGCAPGSGLMPNGCTEHPELPGWSVGAPAVRVSSRPPLRPPRTSRASSAFILPGRRPERTPRRLAVRSRLTRRSQRTFQGLAAIGHPACRPGRTSRRPAPSDCSGRRPGRTARGLAVQEATFCSATATRAGPGRPATAFCSATATRAALGRPEAASLRRRRPHGLARRSAPAAVISTKTVGIVYDLATSVPEEESVECPAPSRAMRQPTSRPPG